MQHSWCDALMVFTDAKTVIIDEKEVKSIVLQDGGVLYKKENIVTEPLILYFKGTEFKKSIYNKPGVFFFFLNIFIDWGDGTTEEYSSETGAIHTYDEDIEHIITILNITSLNETFSEVSDWYLAEPIIWGKMLKHSQKDRNMPFRLASRCV